MSDTPQSLMAHTKSSKVKIVRQTERIGFRVGHTTAQDLITMLTRLPSTAKVDEVIDYYDDGNDELHGIVTIEFHNEKLEE